MPHAFQKGAPDMAKMPKRSDEITTEIGQGGETHQTSGGAAARMTTNQGLPISDDQNTLTIGPRGP
ncbi:MAG: hypothetical protein SH868_02055, partial [Bythopirellula sp.]|nr:hypothetical protein [Bythopirellula sp.]